MGLHNFPCINTQRHAHLLFSLLLVLSSYEARHSSVEGRHLFSLLGTTKMDGEGGVMVMVEAMIGSRPPNCEGRCTYCGRCVAVQVPAAVPQEKSDLRDFFSIDDSSNYKPMSWKCKCGGMLLDP